MNKSNSAGIDICEFKSDVKELISKFSARIMNSSFDKFACFLKYLKKISEDNILDFIIPESKIDFEASMS